eukprot:2861310-Pyramimonas_sp.AAC.1
MATFWGQVFLEPAMCTCCVATLRTRMIELGGRGWEDTGYNCATSTINILDNTDDLTTSPNPITPIR